MKKIACALLLLVMSLTACGTGTDTTEDSGKLQVVTSFYPIYLLAQAVAELQTASGLKSYVVPEKQKPESFPPPSFNLTSAFHHVCGALTSTYESNEGLLDKNQFTAEEILIHHYCLFF